MKQTYATLRHLRNYLTAGFVSAIIGIATFPLLTRNLSVGEYGTVGLVLSTLTLFIALGKFGLQHSIIRFYSEIKSDKHVASENNFFTTTFLIGLVLASIAGIVCIAAGYTIVPYITGSSDINVYFLTGGLYILLRILTSNVSNVLSAQLNSKTVMFSTVLRRVIYLITIVVFLLTNILGVTSVVVAFVFAELVCLIYLLRHYLPGKNHNLNLFNKVLAHDLLRYGVSLMAVETMGLLMRISDRYIIQALMDETAVGQYAASHNFVGYLEIIVLAALISAIRPIYLQTWETQGKEQTRAFLSEGLHIYMLIGIPFVAIFSLTAPHVVTLLAGQNYLSGTVIIPWVAAANFIDGTILFVAAGIYITKKTSRLIGWGLAAVITNVVFNLLFIPKFGIVGASVVTFLTYCVYGCGLAYSSFKFLSIPVSLKNPLIMLAASFAVWFGLYQIPVETDLMAIIIKGAIATGLLAALTLFVDAPLRKLARSKLSTKLNR